MTAIRRIIASGSLLFLALGCSGDRFDWVGHWKGNYNLRPSPGQNEVIAKTMGLIEIKIKPNGTFELYEAGFLKEGDVRYADGKAFLKVEMFMGQPIERQGEGAVKMNQEAVLVPLGPDEVTYEDPGSIRKGPGLSLKTGDGSKLTPLKLKRQPAQPAHSG